MANSQFQQFLFSKTRMLTVIQGQIPIVQEVKAVLVSQGVTYTAVAFGTSGNSITVTITAGGTAGAEVVTVVGNAISVQVEDGVSTVTQVRVAVNASVAAAALVLATGTNVATVSAATVLPLAGGISGISASATLPQGIASASQTGVGEYTITLREAFKALMCCNAKYQASTAVDLIPQIKSTDVVTAKTVVIRLLTGATATDPSAAGTLNFSLYLRNSSIVY